MAIVDDNQFPKLILEERLSDGSDTPNPAADHRTLFLGEDGLLHLRDSAGTITDIGASVADILDLPTAETDDTLVLAPDGAGGVEFRAEAGGGGGGAAVLGATENVTATTYTTTSATQSDVNATDASVAVTIPASGKVVVSLSALVGSGGAVYWGLRQSTTNLAGPRFITQSNGGAIARLTSVFYLTGLTPGAMTIKWAFSANGGATHTIYSGADADASAGPMVMVVWAA